MTLQILTHSIPHELTYLTERYNCTNLKKRPLWKRNLIHSNELHFIDKKRIHRAVEQLVESLELAAGSTTGFNLYAVVESYFTDLNKRRE